MSYLHHVLPSSSLADQTVSRVFLPVPWLIKCTPPVPDCITCFPFSSQTVSRHHVLPPVPRLYHVLQRQSLSLEYIRGMPASFYHSVFCSAASTTVPTTFFLEAQHGNSTRNTPFPPFFNFFYRETETVNSGSGQPVSQGDSSKSFVRFWGLRCGGGGE